MRWLRAHAGYDDAHPWEALGILATLLGASPLEGQIEATRFAIRRSYDYMLLTLQDCLANEGTEATHAAAEMPVA